MKLVDLIKNLEEKEVIGDIENIEISDLVINADLVTKGSLFICLEGNNYDGHDFISIAERYGAKAVVTSKRKDTFLPQIITKNTRKAMSILAKEFYGNPDEKLKIIGVFGTNGKTTVTHMITSILANSNVKCGLIGTLGIFYNDKVISPNLTTPDPILLFKTFREMLDDGVDTVVMEVSAHAIYYDKVFGVNFQLLVFTNFSQDHLDFFKDMENYRNAKLKLIKEGRFKGLVCNIDDYLGKEISFEYPKALTYGINSPSDVFAIEVNNKSDGVSFIINLFDTVYNVKLALIGEFNVYNALASATACALFGIKTDKVIEGLESLNGVDGRVENVYQGEYSVFVDYAHTPDGLEKVLKTLKNITSGKLVCLFGCGGNRDKEKRALMGRISAENSDFTLITSDNPRFEEPLSIMHDIEKGVLEISKSYIMIEDRYQAVKYALERLNKGDVLLIAGKGAETYQDVYGIKKTYNDKDTVKEIINDYLD